ncbi:MAG: DNA primase, partial [Selenomonadaceae bacterium]|nr:DNA primase [Selenomonadaceae bacterium]
GLFYCFGCGAGGNVFKFLSLIENISYFEAIKLQAQRLGIDIPTKRASPEQERRRREEKILFKINELAQDFYHECLIKTARGEVGRKYLAGRGITPETMEIFKLGYAPDEWENLLPRLTRQDFTPQQLETVGLIAKRKNFSGYYDRFRARVMIPITDALGHVVGFGGRILNSADDSTPKYLNTPETVIFNKRNLLFGLDKANRAINAANTAIVVEGYMDAISLFSAGIKNVVATLGTAFTPEHAKLILRYAKKIIFCYDSDEAGQRATVRALPIVQAAGAEVFIVKVPDGKDPDEFVRKHGKDAFLELTKNAATLIDYRINYVMSRAEMSTVAGKTRALREILPVVVKVEDATTRNQYCREIAAAMFMDEQLVKNEWENFSREAEQNTSTEPEKNSSVKRARLPDDEDQIFREACDAILRMAWHEADILDYAIAVVPPEAFSDAHKEIIDWLKLCAAQGRRPDELSAGNELSEEANEKLSRLLIGGSSEPRRTNELAVFTDSLKILQRAGLKKKYDKLLAQAQEYIPSDKEAYVKAVQESLKLKHEMDNLKSN